MAEFICTGSVTLNGVTFYIEAENLHHASVKADRGEWTNYDITGAETSDWDMRPMTVKENK